MAKRILVVEDFDDIRDAMRIQIEINGHQVIEATDGHEAFECAKLQRPDLILMDIAMPAFDGLDATRRLRSDPATAEIPIIAVTSYGAVFREPALSAGCDEVLDKSTVMLNFADELARVLRKYG